jgi:hypothetical protein
MSILSSLVVLGDLHGAYEMGLHAVAPYAQQLGSAVIQVGDLSWHPRYPPPRPTFPVLFLDGNHDFLPDLLACQAPTEVSPGWTYVPRGTVLEIAGFRVGCLGGADSIDAAFRRPGTDWWPEERLTEMQAERLLGSGPVDLLITHTPPARVMRHMGIGQPGPSAAVVDWIWERLGRPRLVCGHMHRKFSLGNMSVLPECGVEWVEGRAPAAASTQV